MPCLDKEQLESILYDITEENVNTTKIDKSQDKALKFDTSAFTKDMIANFLSGTGLSKASVTKIENIMGKLASKLNGMKTVNFSRISTYLTAVSHPNKVVPYNIALKELFDGQTGEYNKMLKTPKIESISEISSKGVMNIPMARSASVIGRKYLQTIGFRFRSNVDSKVSPLQVEAMYNQIGKMILKNMEKDGLVELTDGQVINDFVRVDENYPDTKMRTIKTQVVRPKIEALVTPAEFETNGTAYKDHLKGISVKIGDGQTQEVLDDIITVVNGVNLMKVPTNITLPTLAKMKEENLSNGDYGEITETEAEVRKFLHDTPVYINPRVAPYFRMLAKAWKESDVGFNEFLAKQFQDKASLFNSLGVLPTDLFNADLEQSIRGKNLSKTSPLQDLLENFDDLMGNDEKPNGLHMIYNYVRNARLHMMNSVLNGQSSPYMRYLLTGGENSFSLNSKKHVQHFLAHLIDQGKNAIPDVKLTGDKITGVEVDENLNDWLDMYEEAFITNPNGEYQANLIASFKGVKNPMATLDTLGAIYDFREGMNSSSKMVTTQFQSKPDGTASGGTLTLLQAIAYNPQVLEVLTKLGLINGDVEGSLDDVYHLLTSELESIMDLAANQDTAKNRVKLSPFDKKNISLVQDLLDSGIYKDMRDLSKDPTMTFIYNQQERGAINTIAEVITEKLLTSVSKPETRAYIAKLLGAEKLTASEIIGREGIKKELIAELSKADAAPSYLRKKLEATIDPLIDERKKTIFDIYEAISELVPNGTIKILPNIAVVDGIENTVTNRGKYGIPLAKIRNILHPSEDGDLITMDNRDNATTSVTNTTHSSDASGLLVGIKDTVAALKARGEAVTGVVPVHDQNIASTSFNVEMIEQYTKGTKESLEVYSVEEQLLEQLEQLDPNHPIVEKYKAQIAANVKIKKELLDNFNLESGNVFGEQETDFEVPKKYVRPTKPKPTPPNKPKKSKATESVATEVTPEVEVSTDTEQTQNKTETPAEKANRLAEELAEKDYAEKGTNVRGKELFNALRKISRISPLVASFLGGQAKIGVNKKEGFRFNTNTDYVTLGNVSPITDEDVDYDSPEFKELVEHEIVHSFTAGYLQKELLKADKDMNKAVLYVKKSMNKTLGRLDGVMNNKFRDALSEDALDRLEYVRTRGTEIDQLSEFVAIMTTEKAVADNVYKAVQNVNPEASKLYHFIHVLMGIIEDLIKGGELENTGVLVDSLASIIDSGKSYKTESYKEARKFQAQVGSLSFTDSNTDYARHEKVRVTAPERVVANTMERMNKVTQNVLTSRVERAAISTGKRIDVALNNTFPMYADVRERMVGVYENNAALQELISYMNLDNFKNKILKNEVLSKIHNIHEERNARESQQMQMLTDLTQGFTPEGKKALYDLVSKVPLHNFFRADENIHSEKDLDNRIAMLEQTLTTEDKLRVDDTVQLMVHDKVGNYSMFNTGDFYDSSAVDYAQVEETIALKAIKEAGLVTELFNLKDNHVTLYNAMKDNSLALSELSFKLSDTNPTGKRTKETLVKDLYSENLEFKVITRENLDKYSYEEATGWKVLREPTDTTLGVVYKEKIDEYFLEGAGVSEDLISPDLTVPPYLAKHYNHIGSNVVKAGNGYKLVLTQEEKVKAGVKEDMIETLVRSTSSTIAADDSQVVRNLLLQQSIHSVVDSVDGDAVEDILTRINSKTIDHPWTIKLNDNVKYEDLPQRIKGLYKPVQQNLTMLGKFNENVSLVRKDIRPWLVGGHHPSLFKNPKLQYISRITKGLISATKIGMISTNPAKLALDISSNLTHLSMLGVPASKTARYGKEILGQVNTFNVLKNAVTLAKLKYLANPSDENQKAFDDAVTKLKGSTIYGAHENGFMNSLSSDILNNAVGTTTGLQEDIKRTLEYFTTSSGRGNIEKGKPNGFHKLINEASKFGFDGEDILRFMGKQISRFESKKDFEAYLNKVADNITRMKSQEDVVGYLSQFTVSPNSEFVKAGTWINSMADLMFREIYKRHLMDGGMDEKNAVIGAIEAMPDYKQNMPLSVKILSDYGVLMFPSFFLRTTQPIIDLYKRKLLNVGIEEQLQILLGVDIETLFDANVLHKIDTGLLHSPDEYIGVDSILPTNLFNF